MTDIQQEAINSVEEPAIRQPDVKEDNIDNTVEEETSLATVLLCKQLLGEDFEENPEKVVIKMFQDRKEIALRYDMPIYEDFKDKKEFYSQLIDIAKKNNFTVSYVKKSVLSNTGSAGGINSKGEMVVPNIDFENSSEIERYYWGVAFQHELLHLLQSKMNPNMPIEKMEYEAYVLTSIPNALELHKDAPKGYYRDYLFTNAVFENIMQSCLTYYKNIGIKTEDIPWIKKR